MCTVRANRFSCIYNHLYGPFFGAAMDCSSTREELESLGSTLMLRARRYITQRGSITSIRIIARQDSRFGRPVSYSNGASSALPTNYAFSYLPTKHA